jgi:hypothetical protein
MSREYRIECGSSIDRKMALDLLVESPYFRKPSNPYCDGEVWLSKNAKLDYMEVRLFPCQFGFFLEISSLPPELLGTINDWIKEIKAMGECSIVDNDTEEELKYL